MGHDGDLILKVLVKKDEIFHRVEHNVGSTVKLTISQAILGGKLTIITVDGKRSI